MFGKFLLTMLLLLMSSSVAIAADADPVSSYFLVGNMCLLMAAALVFIMHLGFATLEAGLT